ncbi:hydroxymethylbilane synthase [Aneurinibacillus aneurinilyticus]|jgi:hydroxymethylbilane synthase|uniref:Porphobilinogen deaminase n=2 Tax=Aneurinibacillus aneurinilyticus TaxID=1391 RepID=A0A848CX74_ANEAE|nr:hydroxymethylbilane synthase [Aneurinibacillus aneurinilyticus]ERI11564.1 hydroxymethylbilane synthase [Aneurinibacillus aneurinilyticus ATCC 12856]MCI1693837.1 hydroxymethylbilane synthase [Aneurinibacillus aneurinilyticus]MED0706161.1 hydroxymethylbilane synthase [Aneurinibacillus aneurinilyticus]MED0724551.1 hydroxymethylbilane synthase [Aneurinibacillus aneurinilyticus]MED0734955.1 hydroxymethylbilane synthase [Aneurinibacillus aneurinilyticus]
MRKIVVGSRQSALALTQTNWVIERLKSFGLPFEFEVKKIVTKGDRILDVTLSKVGGKGLFVKEIEQALLSGEIDMAVHSMKDMPAMLPPGLMIGCVPKRVDVRDVLISKDNQPLDKLPSGAIVGTSSLRRAAQLKAFRPDLVIEPIRGNIDTRMRKLKEESFSAIILAAAGLERMQWNGNITEFLPVDISLPAVGQGALAIECRENDAELLALLDKLNDKDTALAVKAERAFLRTLEGGCQVPIAAYANVADDRVSLTGLVAEPDGGTILKEKMESEDPEALGVNLAYKLKEQGADEILEKVYKDNQA